MLFHSQQTTFDIDLKPEVVPSLTGSYLEWDFFVWQLIFFLWFQSVLASVCRCNHIEVYHIAVRHFQNPFALITHQEQPGSMNFSFYRFLSVWLSFFAICLWVLILDYLKYKWIVLLVQHHHPKVLLLLNWPMIFLQLAQRIGSEIGLGVFDWLHFAWNVFLKNDGFPAANFCTGTTYHDQGPVPVLVQSFLAKVDNLPTKPKLLDQRQNLLLSRKSNQILSPSVFSPALLFLSAVDCLHVSFLCELTVIERHQLIEISFLT